MHIYMYIIAQLGPCRVHVVYNTDMIFMVCSLIRFIFAKDGEAVDDAVVSSINVHPLPLFI